MSATSMPPTSRPRCGLLRARLKIPTLCLSELVCLMLFNMYRLRACWWCKGQQGTQDFSDGRMARMDLERRAMALLE